jgi:hypothetical protein
MNPPPLCAQIGFLHGLLVGFGFGMAQGCCGIPTTGDLVAMALILAGFAMLASLFVLVVLRSYAFASVWLAVFINAVVVAVIVVFVLAAIPPSPWGALIGAILGAVMGFIIGWLLCLLCGQRLTAWSAGG